jgi:ElaB/YqjD/DUF883 family membrane-anchored ribosome-binding protein
MEMHMKPMEKGVMETAAETAASVASELSNTARGAGELGKAATRLADQTVHENAWYAIGVAAGIGFLIGLLVRRH